MASAPPPPPPDDVPTSAAAGERDRKLLRRAVIINFAGLVGKGLWPLFLWLVAHWYGAAALGQFTLLQAPFELFLALCSTGFVDGIHRNVARLPGERISDAGYASIRLALRSVLALGLTLVGVAALAGTALVTFLWNRPELHRPLLLMAAAIPLGGITYVLVATATAMMRNEGEAVIKGALLPGLTLALAATPMARAAGIEGLVLSFLAAQVVALVAALFLFTRFASLRRVLKRPVPGLIDPAAQTRFGLVQGLNLMLWMSVYSVDTLLLGAFLGDADVARYRAGSELARLLQYARVQVSSAFAPMAGRYLLRGEKVALQTALHSLPATLAMGALSIGGALGHLAAPLLRAILGTPDDTTYGFVPLLILGHVVVAAFSLSGNTLVLAGKQREILINSAAMTAVNLALATLLIPVAGTTGAAAATLLAMTFAMVRQTFVMRSVLGLTLPLRAFASAGALGAVCYAVSWLPPLALAYAPALDTEWPRALAGAATFAGLFAAALYVFRRRP